MTATATKQLCDLTQHIVHGEPFPHITNDAFIQPQQYAQLCRSFPACPPKVGPTGYSLYWGDEGYAKLLQKEPAWQAVFDTFHSQRFIDWCLQQFASVWQSEDCKIDLTNARYVPYCEDRIDKERRSLRKIEHDPHELFVRMDIHQGQIGYDRPIHLDHARRLLSMLIYMCDQTENDMVGGELFLHSSEKGTNGASPTCIKPQHNRMIAFPCTSRSHHSVSKITAQRTPRNYIQVHISSSVDVWPRAAMPLWRRTLGTLKRKVLSI